MRMLSFLGFGGLALWAGCAVGPAHPARAIPVTLESRSFYAAARVSARSPNGRLTVAGELSLAPGYSLPENFTAHVRVFAADGRQLTEASSRLDRADARFRGDPRREVYFIAETSIPVAEVASIEVTFDHWPDP